MCCLEKKIQFAIDHAALQKTSFFALKCNLCRFKRKSGLSLFREQVAYGTILTLLPPANEVVGK